MRGLNRVALIGNLGKDPEVQTLEDGQTVAKFSLATSETYQDRQGAQGQIYLYGQKMCAGTGGLPAAVRTGYVFI
jgi:single stranded DNA-binding protein